MVYSVFLVGKIERGAGGAGTGTGTDLMALFPVFLGGGTGFMAGLLNFLSSFID